MTGIIVSPTAIAYAKVHRDLKRELSFRTPDWAHVAALEDRMLVISEEQRIEDWEADQAMMDRVLP